MLIIMKWIKRFFLSLVTVVIILFSAGVFLLINIDPNDHKDLIVNEVEKITNRKLTLIGDVDLYLFPWVGLQIGEAELSNAKNFSDEPFATIDSINVKVQLLPLLKRQIEADKIVINGLDLKLKRNSWGLTNWIGLAPPVAPKQEPRTESASEAGSQSKKIQLTNINGLEITDSRVSWQDDLLEQSISADALYVSTGILKLDTPFDVEIQSNISAKDPDIKAELQLTSQIEMDFANQVYKFNASDIKIEGKSDSLAVRNLDLQLQSDISADLNRKSMTFSNTTANIFETVLNADISVSHMDSKPKIKAHVETEVFNPRQLLGDLNIDAPEMLNIDMIEEAQITLDARTRGDELRLENIVAIINDVSFKGGFYMNVPKRPAIDILMRISNLDLDKYLKGKKTTSGRSSQSGIVTINKAEADEPERQVARRNPNTSFSLPIETLRTLSLGADINVHKLTYQGLRLSNFKAQLTAKKAKIKLKKLSAKLLSGKVNATATLDVAGKTPHYAVNATTTNLDVAALLDSVGGSEDFRLRGSLNTTLDLKTAGKKTTSIKKNLNGKFKMNIENGVLTNPKLLRSVEKIYAFFKKKKSKSIGDETAFKTISASSVIKGGIATNKDLVMASPLFVAKGQGVVDIKNSVVDYTLRVGLIEKKRIKHYVPVKIHGKFGDLQYQADFAKLIQKKLDKEIEEEKKKVKKKLKRKKDELLDKLEDEINKKSKGLLKILKDSL